MRAWRGGGEGFLFFKDTATTEMCTLSRHDALPSGGGVEGRWGEEVGRPGEEVGWGGKER